MIVYSDTHVENFSEGATGNTDSKYPGCNSRALNILYAMERAYQAAVAEDTKTVVVPGDIFHRRGIIAVPLFNAVAKVMEWAREEFGIQTIVIPGNHDYADRDAKFADEGLHALWSLAGATVVSTPSIIKVVDHGVRVGLLMIPYTASREVWVKSAAELASQKSPVDEKFLFAHQSFAGAVIGPHEYVMKEGIYLTDLPNGCDAYFSGHYHKFQKVESDKSDKVLWYVGGVVQHNFGERDYEPGYLIVNQHGIEHIEDIKSVRFRVVENNDLEDTVEMMDALVETRPNDIVQVRWNGSKKDMAALSELYGRVVPGSMESNADDQRIKLSGAEAPLEMMAKYVEYCKGKNKIPISDIEKIMGVGRRHLEAGVRSGRV